MVNNSEHLQKLAQFKITPDTIAVCIEDIALLEKSRAIYHREIGELQEATKMKDIVLEELDEWMKDFYAVAKIAMENQPQLLESIGLKVRR